MEMAMQAVFFPGREVSREAWRPIQFLEKKETCRHGEGSPMRSSKLRDVMVIAEKEGLLRGERSRVVLGRMPEALVTRARKRTGIDSDTELIEVALANIAVANDYADWRSIELPVDAFRRSPARAGKVNIYVGSSAASHTRC
jgi:hypothetical protein